MARDLVVSIPTKEDIVSYYYHINNGVTVHVGVGSLDATGNFVPQPEQCYKVYEIYGADMDALLAPTPSKPAGVFRTEDLWPIVDKLIVEEKAKKLAEKDAFDKAAAELAAAELAAEKELKIVKP